MKVLSMVMLLVLCGWMQEAGDKIENAKCTIKKIGNFGYAIVPDDQEGSRFAPTNMDEKFHQDGLRVVFSGIVGELPNSGRGGRVWGTPLELTSIRLLEEE